MNKRIIAGGWLRAIYSVILVILLPMIYLYLWWHGRNNSAYRQRWSERGAWQTVPEKARGSVVFHCVSVGELMAAKPLIDQFLQVNPQQAVTLTCTTPTGSELIQKLYGTRVYHCYLPFDTPLAVRRFINRLRPRALVVLETELWPNLVSQCKQANIKLLLINARMSERSAKGYHQARALMRPIWHALDAVIAQDHSSAERFIQLGCRDDAVHVPGNIKFDVQISAQVKTDIASFKPLLGDRQVITFASSHEGEETQVLEAFAKVLKSRPNTLLILVPRHQERFDTVARLVETAGLHMVRRSEGRPVTTDTQVLLADTMGEMLLWFGVSTIATIGGSLIERGGHNPLEAMAFGLPIVTGRHVFNFQDVYRQLDNLQAVRWVTDTDELHDTWLGLLVETSTAQRLGAQAQQVFAQHRGATSRTLAIVTTHLSPTSNKSAVSNKSAALNKTPVSDKTPGTHPTNPRSARGEFKYSVDVAQCAPGHSHFEATYWQRLGQQEGSAGGRNLAYFIQAQNELCERPMVLRHYYRGGLVGKINRDWFMHSRSKAPRSFAEFDLLQWMHGAGLPVPRPIAARVRTKFGIWYRADILIERLPCDEDVFGILKSAPISRDAWHKIGATIANMHELGVYHSDLNCHNILIRQDDNQIWLIDFDKCERREPGEWQVHNLQRLRRSFDKESALHQGFNFSDEAWGWLIDGYHRAKQHA